MRKIISILIVLLSVIMAASFVSADQSGLRIPKQVTGDLAYDHVYYLSEMIGARIAGSDTEWETAEYIVEQFENMGYEVEVQEFEYERSISKRKFMPRMKNVLTIIGICIIFFIITYFSLTWINFIIIVIAVSACF